MKLIFSYGLVVLQKQKGHLPHPSPFHPLHLGCVHCYSVGVVIPTVLFLYYINNRCFPCLRMSVSVTHDQLLNTNYLVWSPIVVLTSLVCFSYESIKSVCDRYNKAIDSFRQLVSSTHSSTTSSFSDFEFDMSANSGVILCTVHQRLSQIVKHCTLHLVKQQITISEKGSSNGRTMVYKHSLSVDLVQLRDSHLNEQI